MSTRVIFGFELSITQNNELKLKLINLSEK